MDSKDRRSRQASAGVETIQKPHVIEEYNQYMSGVALAETKIKYVWNIKLYCRKEEKEGRETLGEGVVVGLQTGLEHKRCHVCFYNFYTSSTQCKRLLTADFGSCGTIRLGWRNIPKTFRKAAPKKGDICRAPADRKSVV